MARLRQRLAFKPSLFPQSLFLSVDLALFLACTYNVQSSCQLYPSADTVVILDAISLRFLRALAFSQVFPGVTNCKITSLAVDPALKLVCIFPHNATCILTVPTTSPGSCRIRSEACRLVSFWGLRLHLARSLVPRASR